jgi:hypothetical protein
MLYMESIMNAYTTNIPTNSNFPSMSLRAKKSCLMKKPETKILMTLFLFLLHLYYGFESIDSKLLEMSVSSEVVLLLTNFMNVPCQILLLLRNHAKNIKGS